MAKGLWRFVVHILPGMTTFGPRDDIWLSDVTILSHGAIISSKSSINFEMLINLNFFHKICWIFKQYDYTQRALGYNL